MIGDESIARLHEKHGTQLLADIHRLNAEEAIKALCFMAGYAREGLAEIIDELKAKRTPADA